jgi:hypothetical protein
MRESTPQNRREKSRSEFHMQKIIRFHSRISFQATDSQTARGDFKISCVLDSTDFGTSKFKIEVL